MLSTSDTSNFCQHAWYKWLKFRNTSIPFPDSKEVLGRYLGPSIDVGPAMTAKILKANGKVIHRSTYRSLTEQEWADEIETKDHQEFDEKVKVKLGQLMQASDLHDSSPDDMDDIEDMTAYDLYADDNGENHRHAHESNPTPEAGDNYVGAHVLLPHQDQMTSGLVRNQKRDSMGNPSGVSHANPILDTRAYEVVFPDGEVTEYGANVI